jgi:hypothetical protein
MLEYEIKDYKIYCVYGVPKAIQVDSERFSSHKRDFYDINWKPIDVQFIYPNLDVPVEKPENLSELLDIAKKLSEELVFCRIDLYQHNGQVYFGEVTLHPESGNGPFLSEKFDSTLVEVLGLEKIKEEILIKS